MIRSKKQIKHVHCIALPFPAPAPLVLLLQMQIAMPTMNAHTTSILLTATRTNHVSSMPSNVLESWSTRRGKIPINNMSNDIG